MAVSGQLAGFTALPHARYDQSHPLGNSVYGGVPSAVSRMNGRPVGSSPLVKLVYAHLAALDNAIDFRDSCLKSGFPQILPDSVFNRLLVLLNQTRHLAKLVLAPLKRASEARMKGCLHLCMNLLRKGVS